MWRKAWICLAVATFSVAGCHKKVAPVADDTVVFTGGPLASGSTGDTMAQMAQQSGVPLYPGAVPDSSHFNAASNSSGRVYLAYTTTDPTDRVVTFFKANLNVGATTSGAITILSGVTKNGSPITINVGQKMDGSGTSFSIIVASSQADQTSTAVQTYASTTAPSTPPIPPNPAPTAAAKDGAPQDTTTYYVPTANSPSDSTGNVTDGGDGSQTDDSAGHPAGDPGNDQTTSGTGQQTQDGGPPGG